MIDPRQLPRKMARIAGVQTGCRRTHLVCVGKVPIVLAPWRGLYSLSEKVGCFAIECLVNGSIS